MGASVSEADLVRILRYVLDTPNIGDSLDPATRALVTESLRRYEEESHDDAS